MTCHSTLFPFFYIYGISRESVIQIEFVSKFQTLILPVTLINCFPLLFGSSQRFNCSSDAYKKKTHKFGSICSSFSLLEWSQILTLVISIYSCEGKNFDQELHKDLWINFVLNLLGERLNRPHHLFG